MKKKVNHDQLKEIQQLKHEIDALKLLCNQKTTENENLGRKLIAMERMLTPKQTASTDFVPDYGDLSDLNEDGLIKKSIPKHQLQDIVSEYLDLLETSAAIYEKNGDYALGIFSSGWCRMMDAASRKLCDTDDNREALENEKWLCHDSCWKAASLKAMAEGKPAEVACNGGINLYVVPVRANNEIIGAINFGFGSPPKDDAELKKLSEKYNVPLEELKKESKAYQDRPQFIIDYAKNRLQKAAKTIGYLVERRIAEEKLLQSEEYLRITLDSIGDAVISTDLQERITRMNPESERLCACKREQAIGKRLSDVFHIEHAHTGEKVDNPVKKVLETSKVVGLANHTKLMANDGNEYQIADCASPIKDTQGNIIGVVLVFRDITEEYTIHEKLKHSHELMNYIVQHNRSAVAVHDKDLKYIYVSQKYLDDFRVKESEVIGKHHYEVFPDLPQKWREIHQKALTGEIHSAEDDPFYRADGSVDWTRWECRPWYESDGSIGGIIIYTEIINERKHAEMRLQESEEKHRRLFETMSQGVIYQAANGNIISANPAAERMLGLSLDQMLGKTSMDPRWKMITEDGDKVPGKDHPVMIALKTGEKVGPVTRGIYIPEKDKYVWLSITATPLFRPGEKKPFQSYAVFDDITLKKQHEDEIKKQQQLIHTILHNLPIGIAINTFESEPKVELINANFAKIYGLETTDLPTVESFWEAVYEDEAFREKIKNRVLSDVNSGDPKRMQWHDIPITKKGKVVKYVSAQNILLQDHGLMISTVTDTTERKQTENEIIKARNLAEESRLRFKTLFVESPVSILIQDKDTGEIIDANKTAYTSYGFDSLKEMQKGEFWMDPPYSLDDALKQVEKADREGSHVFEWKNRKLTGEIFWELVTLRPLVIDGVERMLATSIDITGQKQKELEKEVLYEIANATFASEDLKSLLASIKESLNKLIYAKNFYVALYDKEKDMFTIPYEEDEKDQIEKWQAKKSTSGLVIRKRRALLLKKPDILKLIKSGEVEQIGNMCEVWLGVPLLSGSDIIGVMAIQDYYNPNAFDKGSKEILEFVSSQISMAIQRKQFVEELVMAKEKAQESDRLKSAFLANMSHEIRTPMNGILGFAELLKEPLLTDEEQQQYIEIIQKSGDRMLNIINDIVDISRIESGHIDITLKELNINEQLDYIYTFFKPQVEAKWMKLILPESLPAEKASTVTDREKLLAVLANLVKNAIKYSNEGTIELGCKILETQGQAFLQFYVRDTGIGIPKDRQNVIFERFMHADIEDIEARQGAGLGLTISKAYVEMLGGEIWVDSEEGKGSTFYFTIPYKKDHQNADKEKTDESGIIVQDKEISLKILIVEDDELSSKLMARFLNEVGKEILLAFNGKEAIDICRKHPDIDLIMMDVKMPGMDGEEATRQIRQFNKDVVIIAQTAKALIGDKQSMLDAGCNDYIAKPINKDHLHALIVKYFGD